MKKTFAEHIDEHQGVIGITADIIIFTVRDGQLAVLLVRRANQPFRRQWAIPGGFIDRGEALEQTARRELQEETGVVGEFTLEQLRTFSDPNRDPRGRVISTVFVALVDEKAVQVRAGDDAKEAKWFPVGTLPRPLAFDHDKILELALGWLRNHPKYGRMV